MSLEPPASGFQPLGIYVQVPFCQTKCTYCNFHTGVFARNLYAPYLDAVCKGITRHAALYAAVGISLPPSARLVSPASPIPGVRCPDSCRDRNRTSRPCVDTVYVGGGTPSLLDPTALARILDAVRTSFCCDFEECTLEADPETVTTEKAAAWRAAGFDRISLGVQSFNDAELKAAGRLHRRAEVLEAVRILRAAGFVNLSFDLIAGLPHQTAASWQNSLDHLLRLRPEHVSIYLLEIDEGSRLGREVLAGGTHYSAGLIPDGDEMAEFYDRARERLAAAGYEHYEISNWALPALSPPRRAEGPVFASRHNRKYWRREPYLGFGAGAHSFNGRERWANAHDPAAYVAAIQQGRLPIEQREQLTPQQALEEELFLGLRQLEGIDLARLESEYPPRGTGLASRLERLRAAGLIEIEGSRVRLSPSRLTVSNEVFVELLS